jgi:soluble lytic murein transglycosylase
MWREAVAAASGSYYALRAGDLAAGVSLRLPLTLTTTLREGTFGAAEREEAGAWVQGWAAESARTLETVAAEPLARRAAALARLGWRADAAAAYRALRDQLNNDAAGLLALAQLTREQRVYSVSIASAERLLALGAKAGASEAPRALRRLAYPTYYSHLVVAEAATRQVDPLLFMALIRQESRFDPVAVSYAGASGLTQVMPDTGTWIATKTGFQGFRPALLARAVVNVPFGVYYLAYQLDRDERDWMGALIAYNAGPGTLSRLTNDKPITDNDLLYETIPYAQTRDYVRLITQQYRIYEELYRPR